MVPLVTVLVEVPSAGMLRGLGVRVNVPAGGPGRKVICVPPLALPCTLATVTFAVPATVPERTTKLITPLLVATWIPGVPASASAAVIVPRDVATVIRVPLETVFPFESVITPLVTVLVVSPSATILDGLGVSVIVPAGGPGMNVICVLPVALPWTLAAVTFAVPTVVLDCTVKLITPFTVATCIPA
jgi:hypothetical protein